MVILIRNILLIEKHRFLRFGANALLRNCRNLVSTAQAEYKQKSDVDKVKQPNKYEFTKTTGWDTVKTPIEELIDIYRNTKEDPKIEERRRKHAFQFFVHIIACILGIVGFFLSLTVYVNYFPY